MLQISDSDDQQPKDMVQSLLSSFDELAKEQAVNEEALKTAFETAFSEGKKQQGLLEEEQSKLNKTKSDEVELHKKLVTAVAHLEKSYKQLSQRAQSMKLFLDRLGGHGAVSTATNTTGAEEKKATALLQLHNLSSRVRSNGS